MSMPVPWVYAIAYLVGVGIQFIVPVTVGSGMLLTAIEVLGILMLGVGALLMAWPQSIFRKHHTTTVPTETTTTFVTWGPYRFSRNPMYLGLFLFFAGLSVAFLTIWSVLLLIVVVYYVNSAVIPVEERQLRKNFGDAYEQYCRHVRRWI
jgi:protein-S-isoprenylcysteine O-methyltransferase Ste14